MGAAPSGLDCDCDCSDGHSEGMLQRDRGAVSVAPLSYATQMQTPPTRLKQPAPIKAKSDAGSGRQLDFGGSRNARGGILKEAAQGGESGTPSSRVKAKEIKPLMSVQEIQRLEEEEALMEMGIGSKSWSPDPKAAREKALRVLAMEGKVWICKHCKLVNKRANGTVCSRCQNALKDHKQTMHEMEADLYDVLSEAKTSQESLEVLKRYVESPLGEGPRAPPKNEGVRVSRDG
uniref:Uncharacterized protein n=1 Tax=Hemiselmis andersenii TaxID=464988 RepID=A0A6U4VYS9_HEMAN